VNAYRKNGVSSIIMPPWYLAKQGLFHGIKVRHVNFRGSIEQVETFIPLTKTWDGSFDDNWSVADNWTSADMPVSIDNVNIPAFAPWMPLYLKSNLTTEKTEVSQRKQRNNYLISNPLFPLSIL
jgi:hypothetical protein